MKKAPKGTLKVGLLAMGLLAAFFILDFVLAIAGGKPRWILSRAFARAAGCTVLFFFVLYQYWKNHK